MHSASDIADWWDKQHAESKKVLDEYVDTNPGLFSVIVATAVSTAMEVGAGAVDVLRLGKGVAENGLAGIGEDALRLISLPVIGGTVAGAGGRLAKTAVGAVAKRIPKSAISAVTQCPLVQKTAMLARKTKAVLGKNLFGKSTQKVSKTCTSGCPISMVTGEELLEQEDFSLEGPVNLRWTRFYRTGQSSVNLQLGHGWLTPLDEWLDITEAGVSYHDKEGRTVELPLPEPGDYSLNLPEQIRLYRQEDLFRLVDEDGAQRIFEVGQGQQRYRLKSWQNDAGQNIELIYNEKGQVRALRTSWGKLILIQRDGTRISAIGPAKEGVNGLEFIAMPWVRYQYDQQGDLVAVRDRLDQGESYAYRNHIIIRRTLASGFNFYFEWDSYMPDGRCVHNFGDNGIYDYRFEWTSSGISRAIDSRGGITEYMHDTNALLLWEISPERRTTRYAYDRNKLLSSITDPAGHQTCYEYDEEGHITSITDALGQTTQLEYDVNGNPIKLTDSLGQTWRRSYDEQNRLIQSQDPLGGITQFAYNPQGLPAKVINPVGQTRTLLWDEQARLVGEIGFNGLRRHFKYDAEDRIVATITQDKLVSSYQYDAAGRVITAKAPDGSVVELKYNKAGLLTHYTDAGKRTTEYRYTDGLSQVTERINATGHVLRYHYDSERNLIGLTNAKGEQYRLNYDKDENLIEEIGFDGRVQRYHYDTAGFLDQYAQQGEHNWQLSRFERDPLGRLLKKTAADGAISEFGYDALGRLHYAQNNHSLLLFRYNSLGQVIQEIQNNTTIAHEYDAIGRRTATIIPAGQRIEYRYNAQGTLQAVALDGEIVSRHQFDELGLETARQQGALVSQYDYDPMGRLTRQQAKHANNTTILGRQYAYDITGKLDMINDIRQGQSRYIYDPSDRLLQVDGINPETFVHDPADNLIGINHEVGGLVKGDRLLMMGDRHYAYDAAGNLIEEKRGKAGQIVTRYQYDGDNHLVRAETPQGVAHYRYDALGRRIAKHTAQGETRFQYDGPRLLAETDSQRSRTYLFEPGSFRPLARVDQAGADGERAVYYYHLDHLGTPKEMTDAQGRIVWSVQYRAYGSLAFADVALIENPIRFQGQYFDQETGLHYNLNRYYDPNAGRFIHQDPIGLAGGENLFQYVVNPVNWIDPLGLTCGEGLTGSNWKFNPQKDVDLRGTGKTYSDALDEAFKRTGIPKNEFEVTKWGKNKYGKSIPVEWQGPGGANVNMDIPAWNNVRVNGALGEGPHSPHIGYQKPGKPRSRGHIFVDDVPATRL